MASIKTDPALADLAAHLAKMGVERDVTILPGADPARNFLDYVKCHIADEMHAVTDGAVSRELVFESLDFPAKLDVADLTLPVPRLRVKPPHGKKPADLAAEWTQKFSSPLVTASASNIFCQFKVTPDFAVPEVLGRIFRSKKAYGTNADGAGKRAVIEFSSPNIAKPFHAGHLRSTIIGSFLSNLHEANGWEVLRINYLGDWGKQFGLLAIGFEKYGSERELEIDAIKHLYDVYVKIYSEAKKEEDGGASAAATGDDESPNVDEDLADGAAGTLHDQARQFFKRMEDGDESALAVWRRFRDLSIEKLEKTYARLNIRYDVYSGESQVSAEKMNAALEQLESSGLIEDSNGAKVIDLLKYSKQLARTIVQKRDGTTLYLTRDIGEAISRYEKYHFDKMIYVVASQQDLHMAQLFKILELLGYDWAKTCEHVNFGMVQGMSTRKGQAVFLDDILQVGKERMHEVMRRNEAKYAQIEDPDSVADIISKTAIMVQDMSSKRINGYPFNWDRMLSFEGDTGPYLQYAHARLASMFRKSDIPLDELTGADLSLLTEKQAINIVRMLAQYPEIIKITLRTEEPVNILNYLFRLTHGISSLYDVCWVSGQERELARARLALYMAAKQVLSNGMMILGYTPLER